MWLNIDFFPRLEELQQKVQNLNINATQVPPISMEDVLLRLLRTNDDNTTSVVEPKKKDTLICMDRPRSLMESLLDGTSKLASRANSREVREMSNHWQEN